MKCRITMKLSQTLRILIKILLVSSLLCCCNCGYKSKYKAALSKAKSYYKANFKKDKTWHFLGHDLTEYPGHNDKYKKMHKEKWDEYYKCLNIQNNALGIHGSVVPEAVQGFEGHLTSFDCKICLSPKERLNIDSVVWYWAPIESDNLVEVEYTEHILIAPEDKTLTMYNLQVDQTGLYVCKLGTALTAPYYLTVVNSTTNITEVHTEFASEGPYPKNTQIIKEYNLLLDTVWGEWSPCSTCKNVGKRHKFGYCIVLTSSEKYIAQNVEIPSNSSNNNVSFKKTQQYMKSFCESFNSRLDYLTYNFTKTRYKSRLLNTNFKKPSLKILAALENSTKIPVLNRMRRKNTKDYLENDTDEDVIRDLELVRIFENGIPCLSHILPESIKKLVQKENRTNEVLIGYCKVACPEETVFEVKDKKGNVIETANNSAGIYSMLQGIPQVEPPVKRMLQYEKTGETIIISCPGNLNSDTPIQWQLGSTKLIAELISQQSNKRIFISVSDKIHIQKAKVSDSNIYSCWQNNELAGTIRLAVEKQIKLSFNHHIMLFGMVVILATFLYIFAKAVFGSKYTKYAQ